MFIYICKKQITLKISKFILIPIKGEILNYWYKGVTAFGAYSHCMFWLYNDNHDDIVGDGGDDNVDDECIV